LCSKAELLQNPFEVSAPFHLEHEFENKKNEQKQGYKKKQICSMATADGAATWSKMFF
jgi:hypothetical protein